MRKYRWYRRLLGGVWLFALQSWHKAIPEKYEDTFWLKERGFKVEDHRYKWEKHGY